MNNKHFASIWGNAVSIGENRPESYGKNITLRYNIYSPFDGEQVRVTFDNYCGTEPITITKSSFCADDTFVTLTYGGKESVTVAAGESVVSDEVKVTVVAGSTSFVSFYLGDFTQMRSAVYTCGPLTKGVYAVGDYTYEKDIPITVSRSTNIFYFLSNVSVLTSKENRTIVCYGDSITAQDWPDYLNLRLREGGYKHTAAIRRATSGSRILREYDCLTYASYGLMGSKRFFHEVPTDGADTVLIQQGINDIIHPVGVEVNPFRPMSDLPTADQLIEGLKRYIELARSYDYKVYVGTLLPIKGWRTYAPFRDELKDAYNEFIRTTDLIDGVVDFDKALRNPQDPAAFLDKYDSGDHLHPSALGYKRMAEEVPVEMFR